MSLSPGFFFRKFSEDLDKMQKGHLCIQQLSEEQVDMNKCFKGVCRSGRGADPGRRWQCDQHRFLPWSKVAGKREGLEAEVKTGRIATRVQFSYQSGLHIRGHGSPGQTQHHSLTATVHNHGSYPSVGSSLIYNYAVACTCITHI